MPQPSRDDREPQDVTDLDTARLALRGAVESLRSLQEVNQRLKGEMQEYANRNKLLDQRLIELQTELNAVNAKLDHQDDIYEKREDALRRSIRQEVALEENQRWQAEMAALRQSLEMWKAAREQKEAELERVNQTLAAKETDILDLQKEKVIIQGKVNQDLANLLAKAREDLRQAVEAVIQEKNKQLQVVKAELAEEIHDLETRLRVKEEEAQVRDENIAKQFHERQKELSEFWAKREQEIWDRAKQAKETLEAGLKERWESRLKDLLQEYEQKTALLKQQFANQQAELQLKDQDLHAELERQDAALKEAFSKKANALEQSHLERAAALEMQWNVKEKKLMDAHRKALDAERGRLQEDLRLVKEQSNAWQVTRDADYHAKEAELRQRHQNLEKELRETWGKREEELTLRHAAELKKTQDVLYQTLHDKLMEASRDYATQVESLQTQLASVDAKRLEYETELKGVQSRLTGVGKERTELAVKLEERETAFQKLFEEKESQWTGANDALRAQQVSLTAEFVERDEVQKTRIADLERESREAQSQIKVLTQQLEGLEKERTVLAETLQAHEAQFRHQLEIREREWTTLNESLRTQLAALTRDTSQKIETLQKLASSLEKQNTDMTLRTQTLELQLQTLEHERTQISNTLQSRIAGLEKELTVKQSEWKAIQDALQDQLKKVAEGSAKHNEVQMARIVDLETQVLQARSEAKILLQKLEHTQAERTELLGKAESREATLKKEFETAHVEWNAAHEKLQQQLKAQAQDAVQKQEAFKGQVSDLERLHAEAKSRVQALQQRIEGLDKERTSLMETLESRETASQKQLQESEQTWAVSKEALERQLALLKRDAGEKDDAHQAQIAHLGKEADETRAQWMAVRGRLSNVEKERDTLQETSRSRDKALRSELREKELVWERTQRELQEQLTEVSKAAVREREEQKSKISDLTVRHAEAQAFVQELSQRESELKKRTAALERSIRARETELEQRAANLEEDLRKGWAEKERALSQRIQTSLEREQARFWERIRQVEASSQAQLSKLQADCLRQEEDLAQRKKSLNQKEIETLARLEERELRLRDVERKLDEEGRRQFSELEQEKAGWGDRLKRLKAEEDDVRKRQTELQTRHAELDRLRDQLTASLDAGGGRANPAAIQSIIEEWVFGFAHQVRNPLGIIRSMTESLMLTRFSGKEKKGSFSAILQAVDGLTRRLGEFIDFSKPLKPSFQSTVLSDVCEKALALIREEASRQGVEIRTRWSDNVPVLSLDPDHLQTALAHLLRNALEAMPEGGDLTVDIRQESNIVALRVQDSGNGISVAHMKEIGRPFFTTKADHIGLGLASAKRVLHLFGADLSFDSRPGQETTVVCRFKAKGK